MSQQGTWHSGGTAVLRGVLIVVAVGCFLAAAAMFVVGAMALLEGTRAGFAQAGMFGLVGAGGVLAGVVLLGFASNLKLLVVQIRQQQLLQATMSGLQEHVLRLEQAMKEKPAVTQYVPVAQPVRGNGGGSGEGEGGEGTQRVLGVLGELRDLALMDEAQRAAVRRRHFAGRKEAALKQIDRAVDRGQWAEALQAAEELAALLPGDEEVRALVSQVNGKRDGRIAQDIEAARVQLRHLMSITAWAQAEEVVGELQRKYDHAGAVEALAAEVRREREAFEREHLQRLMLDLRDASEHRQWRRALMVAEELVRRHGDDPRVARLQNGDLTTIKENAEAQERREDEALFKDLLHRQRYEDAAEVARRVINKYPTSNAAIELNKLLPKVEELVRQRRG